MNRIFFILVIVTIGPIIGSFLGVIKKPSEEYLSSMLSFAAGVMLSISLVNLVPESIKYSSGLLCGIGVILGILVMYSFDFIIPHIDSCSSHEAGKDKYKRPVFLLILGIIMHNFPEGMTIGISSVSTFKLSVPIAFALAIHDIPESICTSAPYYYISKNRIKSFLISISTIIPTLIGFLITFFVFKNISFSILGILIGGAAGLMVYISVLELIPMALAKKKSNSTAIISLICGMVMVLLLVLL